MQHKNIKHLNNDFDKIYHLHPVMYSKQVKLQNLRLRIHTFVDVKKNSLSLNMK